MISSSVLVCFLEFYELGCIINIRMYNNSLIYTCSGEYATLDIPKTKDLKEMMRRTKDLDVGPFSLGSF